MDEPESDHLRALVTQSNARDGEVVSQEPRGISKGVLLREHHTHAGTQGAFGLWRVCFPPCLVRPGRRLPVQRLSAGSLGFLDRLPA